MVPITSYQSRSGEFKKNSKKIQKIKNTIMASFKPNNVGKGREREKIKIIVQITSYLTRNRQFQKNSNKIQKIKKYHYGFFQAKIGWKRPKREEKKIIGPFRSVLDRVEKFKKKIAKKFKKFKYIITASFRSKIGRKGLRKRENKNYRSVSFLPTVSEEIPQK